jgi:hypothetical protein
MTADARPPIPSTPTAVTCRHQVLREGYRLFPTRLSFERSSLQSSAKPPEDLASLTWLLSRLWLHHSILERRIAEAAARPRPDSAALSALKRERLAVRDRIAALERGI